MFDSIFSKVLDLFGKNFIIAGFLPALIFFSCVYISLNPVDYFLFINKWLEKEVSAKISDAVLVLFIIYLFAYMIYGFRDSLVIFFRSGWLWLLPKIKRLRREHFIKKRRRIARGYASSLPVLKASVWAEYGFLDTGIDDNVIIPKKTNEKKIKKRIEAYLSKFERNKNLTNIDELSWESETNLMNLFNELYFYSYFKKSKIQSDFIKRLKTICEVDGKNERFKQWCKNIQSRTYGDVGNAYFPLYQFPPEKYIQSTALGNVLSWALTYSNERYGIESEFLLPRLSKVIDNDFAVKIEDKKTFFDLTIIFTMFSFTGAVFLMILLILNFFPVNLSWVKTFNHFYWLIPTWLVFCFLFYHASVVSARAYGIIINSTIDLYRLNLIDELKIKNPADAKEEIDIWKKLNTSFLNNKVPEIQYKNDAEHP